MFLSAFISELLKTTQVHTAEVLLLHASAQVLNLRSLSGLLDQYNQNLLSLCPSLLLSCSMLMSYTTNLPVYLFLATAKLREVIRKKKCLLLDIVQKGGGGSTQIQKFWGIFLGGLLLDNTEERGVG